MKKGILKYNIKNLLILLIIFLIVIFSSYCASMAYADENEEEVIDDPYVPVEDDSEQDAIPIFANSSLYIVIKQPSLVVANEDILAIVDGNVLKITGKYSSNISLSHLTFDEIVEIKLYNNYIFLVYSSNGIYNVTAFNMKYQTNGNAFKSYASIRISNSFPYSITFDSENNLLYARYSSDIFSFKLEERDDALYIDETPIHIKNTPPNSISSYDKAILYKDECLYILRYTSSNKHSIIKYNIENNTEIILFTANQMQFDNFALDAKFIFDFSEDNILISTHNQITIFSLDGSNNHSYITTTSDFDGLAVYNNQIYLSYLSKATVKCYELKNSELIFVKQYGYYSSDENFFNKPTVVKSFENHMFILDSENKRIVRYTFEEESFQGSYIISDIIYAILPFDSFAKDMAVDNQGNIYLTDNFQTIYTLNSDLEITNTVITTISEIKSLDVDFDSNIFVSNGTSIYKKIHDENDWSEIIKNANVTKFFVSKRGATVYTVQDKNLRMYDKSGKAYQITATSLPKYGIDEIKDIQADYKGNLYILFYGGLGELKIAKFERTSTKSFQFKIRVTITIDKDNKKGLDNTKCVSFNIDEFGNFIIVNEGFHIIEYVDGGLFLNASTISNSELDFPNPTNDTSVEILISKADATILYRKPNNYEDTISVNANTLFIVSNNETIFDNAKYFFVTYKGNMYYIKETDVNYVLDSDPTYNRGIITHSALKIYHRPIEDDNYLKAEITNKSVLIDISSRIGYIDETIKLDFFYITCGDISGYAKADRISKYYNHEYATTDPNYMYVRTEGIGKKIPLFVSASLNAQKHCYIGDGEKIILLQEYDENRDFTLVSYSGFEGYVETSLLYTSGLSHLQKLLLFIVFTVVLVVISVVIIRFIIKKNSIGRNRHYK